MLTDASETTQMVMGLGQREVPDDAGDDDSDVMAW